jgi:hypothetical protein
LTRTNPYATSRHNDLTIAPGGGANPTPDQGANAAALPVAAHGHKVYGVYILANRCCFDYGNAETNNLDTGNGDMDAIYVGTLCSFAPCSGTPARLGMWQNNIRRLWSIALYTRSGPPVGEWTGLGIAARPRSRLRLLACGR